MLSAVVVIVVFLIVVMWHEFGHFMMAKLSGVLVNEFSIGMGPKLFLREEKKHFILYVHCLLEVLYLWMAKRSRAEMLGRSTMRHCIREP